jgi:type II secretory ATPase GspE/PulE/Tfp pilus assembly ATPase PilB-like protein
MGVEPFLIASALKMVISQRLVKRLCQNCHISKTVTNPVMIERLRDELGSIFDDDVSQTEFSFPGGCAACGDTGFK